MRELPELFDLRVKARSLAYLFFAGASLGMLTLVLPHDEDLRDLQLWICAGVAIAIAAVACAQSMSMSFNSNAASCSRGSPGGMRGSASVVASRHIWVAITRRLRSSI